MHKKRLACGLLLTCAGLMAVPVRAGGGIGVSPTSVNFGSVNANTISQAVTIMISNGGGPVSIQQISSNLPEFIVTAPAMPINLGPHGNASIQIAFQPDLATSFSGTITLMTNRKGFLSIPVSGAGTPAPAPTPSPSTAPTYWLSPSASSLNLGKMLVGTSTSQTLTVTNTGTGGVNISSISVSQGTAGAGFTVSGLSGTTTLAAGQSLPLTVSFAPTVTGTFSGMLNVASNATNSPVAVALSGTGVQPQISVVPTSISFGKVTDGTTNTQAFTISNTGTANLSVSQPVVAGTGFSLVSGSAVSIPPGGSSPITVAFTPQTASSYSGNLTLTNNSPNSSLVVPLSGFGIAAVLQITPTPSSVNFGSIATQTSTTQAVTLTNTGNSNISISQIAASGAGFSASGFAAPIALTPNQSTSFNAAFAPTTAGSVSGNITVTSTATNSPLIISLTGSGSAPVTHSVALSWSPSSSTFAGFNVYRGSVSGGPYTKLDSSLVPTAFYTDSSVTSGQTYYYVATEVNSAGVESPYSSEASATIP